jgi:hypothetical protein
MFYAPRMVLLVLGLVGAVVGVYFGINGALTTREAVDEVNRKGGDEASLFRAANLAPVLENVRAEVGADGELLELAIYPGYAMVEASTGSEEQGRAFKVQSDGDIVEPRGLNLIGPGKLADNVFPLAKLDARAIEKLANAAAAKDHRTLDEVTHIMAMVQPDSGKPGLNVYLSNSQYWRAGLDGSGLSNPSDSARAAMANAQNTVDVANATTKAIDDAAARSAADADKAAGKAAKDADDLAACVQAAGTDAEKLAACAG